MAIDRFAKGSVPALDPAFLRSEVRRFLAEDVGAGDVTTNSVVPPEARAAGWIVAREPCVVAGLDAAEAVYAELDRTVSFERLVNGGDPVRAGSRIARLEGPARPILTGERLALNLLQRLSGVATVTRRYVDAIAGTGASVSDTRKTTPGLRLLEKEAVRLGGGRNHRLGLYDGVLVKDNHLVAAGGIRAAVAAARAASPSLPLQVEVDSLGQLDEALDAGVDAVLLDNMPPARVAEAVARIRAHPRGADCWIEASGGIAFDTLRGYAAAGVDTVSVGALTHSAPSVDIGLDFQASRD